MLSGTGSGSHFIEDCIVFIRGKQAGFTWLLKKLQRCGPEEDSIEYGTNHVYTEITLKNNDCTEVDEDLQSSI